VGVVTLAPIDPTTISVDDLRERVQLLLDDPALVPQEPAPEGSFRCGVCLRVFEFEWSDEEALAEMRERFGDVPPEEQVVLCDDCFRIVG
jgi:hypothetical protein